MNELESIWKQYGIFREKIVSDSAIGYSVNHTARIYLVNADGNLRLSYGYQTRMKDIVSDLNILLK